ncbi:MULTISPECIES: hypothetical protein [Dethiosulfovibrio]|uniref:Alkyl hydroperoxide reductase n=2 Tax=Dethiosulfovibrio TaxID=47054 RepID=A0ABS9EP73_9BACT|nr:MULTISPECIES: hypothetical protein [Dethiosulfovibrio]MCF4114347.1 hypothetical protein [Dethiosulfovibrio russensis]MCF4142992.1 hypothetical protein [Dethiosulfovibrio marinus]MCF4145089.1 hypothetical protein [Dethiosulfovibrio acidaminovorans]
MVTIYGGAAPAPDLPDRIVDGTSIRLPGVGRVTVLVFFNAMSDDDLSVVDGLMRLREEDRDAVDLIGVHCPRFPAEKESRRILSVLDCAGIDFPVYDDSRKNIRKAYLINRWPSTVVVDPTGALTWAREGILPPELVRPVLKSMGRTARVTGDLRPGAQQRFLWSGRSFLPLRLAVEGDTLAVLDGRERRLLLAQLDPDGRSAVLKRSIPMDRPGFRSCPTGFSIDPEKIYVADRGAETVRIFDRNGREISSYSGKPSKSNLVGPRSFGAVRDVVCRDDMLYLASPGTRQIWVQSMSGGGARPFAGNGGGGMDDGPPYTATMGQPEALLSYGNLLFFSDSGSSSIRCIDPSTGKITTLIGEGPSLYGCRDGIASRALLQRPLGMCLSGGSLYIADSYNDRIRALDVRTMEVSTVYGDRRWQRLFSPSDVAIRDGVVYVADLGNGRVVAFDEHRGEPEVLRISGIS